MIAFPEVNELSEEVRRVFDEFDRRQGYAYRNVTGTYTPPLDVFETADAVEVVVDLPGVPKDAVRVIFKLGALIVAGEKMAPEPCEADHRAFHLVERGFGRFARVVRLPLAIDASRTRATLRGGELRITIPRITERRGRDIPIDVDEGP